MNNLDQLLKILDEGAFITCEEMSELAEEVRALKQDVERYRWLKRYAGQLLMATEVQIDARIDQAIYGREK